jgi:hypothetical protein
MAINQPVVPSRRSMDLILIGWLRQCIDKLAGSCAESEEV